MTLRENINDRKGELEGLNLETFGEMMDKVIEASRLGLLVKKEEGETEFDVLGAGCGAVMDFYIFLNALPVLFEKMLEELNHQLKGQQLEAEKLAEVLCEEMKKELIKAAKEE